MPNIEPVPADEIQDPELRQILAEADALGVPGSLFIRVLAHVPEYAKTLYRAMHMAHSEGSLDPKLKEIVRVQLARTAEDTYFANLRSQQAKNDGLTEELIDAGSGDYDDDPRFSEAEKWALRYADQMYLDPAKVDASFYVEMKRHFTEAQIMELGTMIALHHGMHVFMRTLQLFPERDPEGNPVSQEQAKAIYGDTVSR
ncbi:MAG: carboxymuconolactone decarboxylase family protein [Dehalococcoidia bacterium]